MYVASLENCKELYELSGWDDAELEHWFDDNPPYLARYGSIPAYDLGYLLRKLPKRHSVGRTTLHKPEWFAEVGAVTTVADTPEDAAAKLAIELFKQGILQKETV